jgi:hypothetical protein
MNETPSGDLMIELAKHLQEMPAVQRFADRRRKRSTKEEAWEIAHGLTDILESTKTIFEKLLPRLLQLPPEDDKAEEFLYEIGEEYRHIFYHIRNTDFFSYVVADGSEDESLEDAGREPNAFT